MTFKLFVTVLLLCAPALPASIAIGVPKTLVAPGEIFSIHVTGTDMTDLYTFQFDVSFDSNLLSAMSITEGSLLSGAGTTLFIPGLIDNPTGMISFTAGTLVGAISGITGSGTLASVQFLATGQGMSAVALSNVVLLDSTLTDILASAQGGSVTVGAVPEPASFVLCGLSTAVLLVLSQRSVQR